MNTTHKYQKKTLPGYPDYIARATLNFDMFELHEFNRQLHRVAELKSSISDMGFAPSSPIHCIENGDGKLKIIRGHHRYFVAKALNVPLYFMVDNKHKDILKFETVTHQSFSIKDFGTAHARTGNKEYQLLMGFSESHKIGIGAAAALLSTKMGGPNNHNEGRNLKLGGFKVTTPEHAEIVATIVEECDRQEIYFAKQASFINAVSICLDVSGFSHRHFITKVKSFPAKMKKRTFVHEYIVEIERLYNYFVEAHKKLEIVYETKRKYQEWREKEAKNKQKVKFLKT